MRLSSGLAALWSNIIAKPRFKSIFCLLLVLPLTALAIADGLAANPLAIKVAQDSKTAVPAKKTGKQQHRQAFSLGRKLKPTGTPPAGFAFVPIDWCAFYPDLPICPATLLPGESEVTNFGQNPGNLKMFKFVPPDLGASRPLVVALHGCTQKATSYDDEPGWVELAQKFHFALLLPQQQMVNNSSSCFRWFDSSHNQRGKGEALSIKNMIDNMKNDPGLKIDPKRIYITGLSGGGAMTAVMLATYPEIFAGGGIIAGIPYGCAHTANEATSQCGVNLQGGTTPIKNLTAEEWGDLVRNANPGYTGPYPRVSIWQGTADQVVNPQDENELIKQWTNLLQVGQTPQVTETVKGNTRHQVFKEVNGAAMVEAFFVPQGTHGTPIDPGTGEDQCGKRPHDQWILEEGICSSYFIAKFWGLDKQ